MKFYIFAVGVVVGVVFLVFAHFGFYSHFNSVRSLPASLSYICVCVCSFTAESGLMWYYDITRRTLTTIRVLNIIRQTLRKDYVDIIKLIKGIENGIKRRICRDSWIKIQHQIRGREKDENVRELYVITIGII